MSTFETTVSGYQGKAQTTIKVWVFPVDGTAGRTNLQQVQRIVLLEIHAIPRKTKNSTFK